MDGKVLLTLNDEDFDNLNVNSGIHRKRLLLELERLFPLRDREVEEDEEDMYIKRERIKSLKRKEYAASVIQREFRCYLGKLLIIKMKLVLRLAHNNDILDKKIKSTEGWWTDKDIPSKHINVISAIRENNKEKVFNKEINEKLFVQKQKKEKNLFEKETERSKIKKQMETNHKNNRRESLKSICSIDTLNNNELTIQINNKKKEKTQEDMVNENIKKATKIEYYLLSQNESARYIGIVTAKDQEPLPLLKFPVIKTYGRKIDHNSIYGWGRFDDRGVWVDIQGENEIEKNSDKNSSNNGNNMKNGSSNMKNSSSNSGSNVNRHIKDIDRNNLNYYSQSFNSTINPTKNTKNNINNLNNNNKINNQTAPASPLVYSVFDDISYNPTRLLTEKLSTSGYDKRRMDKFLRDLNT